MKWTNEKPTEAGLYFRSNPALQKDVTRQEVFEIDGYLATIHPHNDSAKVIKIEDMPKSFRWIKIPYPKIN